MEACPVASGHRALALRRQVLAMSDRDQPLPQGGHVTYDAAKSPTTLGSPRRGTGDGEAVGTVVQEGMAATPRLFGCVRNRLRLSGQVVEWAYGYSDPTIR
jgi:hypothetical protein